MPKGWRGGTDSARPPLHVLHIGKTGGTALKEALLGAVEVTRFEILLHGHDVRLAHIPPGERFMFTVRDPLARFVSGFNGRLREDRPRYDYPWLETEKAAFTNFRTPNELATALSARDRSRRKEAERAMRGIGHVNAPYSRWFGSPRSFRARISDLYFVAFQDRLVDDFELLKVRLELPSDLFLPSDETKAHRTPPGFSSELNEVARANLERWYARDLAFVRLCRELAPEVNRGAPVSG